ncbi:MAG: amidohydrolase [Peptostreptococcaceae bacterium]|nr:amidohydrolase [Peptostreptococcaceae bacterium]
MKFVEANVFCTREGKFKKTSLQIKDRVFVDFSEAEQDETLRFPGCYITPGLIDAHSHLGMWEENLGIEGADGNETTDPVTPHLRAIDGINPMDIAFKKALQGGVTTVSSGPGSANVIGGQWAVIKTFGKVINDMILRPYSSMKCAFGENPKRFYGSSGKMPATRMAIAGLLRKTLAETIDYCKRKEEALQYKDVPKYDAVLEAMIPVIKREVPLKIHVHRSDDILTAIRIVREFDLKASLDHCTEGHLIPAQIKASGLPVILGPTFGFNSKVELSHKTFDTPRILFESDIKFAIMTDHPVHPQSSLILWAIFSCKAGLPEGEALRAVTIYPAEILGIADRVGSIEVGKDADFVIWDRHPMDAYAKPISVWVNGKEAFHSENQAF